MNLLPDRTPRTLNYWCTWSAQHPMWDIQSDEELASFDFYKASEGGNVARSRMNQRVLLENPGWAPHFWPRDRGELYLCLDDGWDVPPYIDAQSERWRFGSLILDQDRFPSFRGTPAERLHRLNERLKTLGWHGLAIWIAAQCEGDGRDNHFADERACEHYWRERARWSAEAGIGYWKVDWGARCGSAAFRRMLTSIAREEAPDLAIEHACCIAPVNNIPGNGRFADAGPACEESTNFLSFSDVFRSYDSVGQIAVAITLDRINTWMRRVVMEPGAKGIINCEDEVYLGAAMGFAFGVMRVPVRNPYTKWKWPRIDEASRAVRWQRLAPAFGVACNKSSASARDLTDTFKIRTDFWDKNLAGREVQQHAPAVMSRGMPLPRVLCDSEPPYVVAAKNPAGPISVAALRRCLQSKSEHPLADVEIDIADIAHPIGIFGRFRTLTLRLPPSISASRIWTQDLLSDQARDVTSRVKIADGSAVLDGSLLDEVGLSDATKDDPSDPALVLKIEP